MSLVFCSTAGPQSRDAGTFEDLVQQVWHFSDCVLSASLVALEFGPFLS